MINPSDRKTQSERKLYLNEIRINSQLPELEDSTQISLRRSQEIRERVVVLFINCMVAFDQISGEQAVTFFHRFGLLKSLTNKERSFLDSLSDEEKLDESWKCEGILVMLWVLRKAQELPFPDHLCNLNDIPTDNWPVQNLETNPISFIQEAASLRDKEEILDQYDLHFRLNWARLDAEARDQHYENMNARVVYERQYAFNWLLRRKDQNWDDITST